jgi:hypothetical protein
MYVVVILCIYDLNIFRKITIIILCKFKKNKRVLIFDAINVDLTSMARLGFFFSMA